MAALFLRRASVLPGEEVREDGPAYGMVGAAERARHHAERCLGVCRQAFGVGKEVCRKDGRHARVLHAHLDGDGALLRGVELERTPDAIAKHVPECIVAEYHRKHEEDKAEPVRQELRAHSHHHAAHDEHKPDDADRRHVCLDFLEHGAVPEEEVQQEADGHREDGYVQDIKEHPERVHVDARVRKPEDEQRGHDRREQGRDRSHAHGVGHVALREETHYVARDAARAATHEDYPYGEVGVEPEDLRERKRHQGHDGVLGRRPEQYVERAFEQDLEVLHGKREPHAQHDDAEDDGRDVSVNPAEGDGEEERDDSACDDEWGSVGREKVACGPDNPGHA